MEAVLFILGILLLVLCVYAAGQMALRRGRSAKGWMWTTAIFGPPALVLLALLGHRRHSKIAP